MTTATPATTTPTNDNDNNNDNDNDNDIDNDNDNDNDNDISQWQRQWQWQPLSHNDCFGNNIRLLFWINFNLINPFSVVSNFGERPLNCHLIF